MFATNLSSVVQQVNFGNTLLSLVLQVKNAPSQKYFWSSSSLFGYTLGAVTPFAFMRVSVSVVELEIGCIHSGAFVWLYRLSAFSEFPGGSCLMMNIELWLSQGW